MGTAVVPHSINDGAGVQSVVLKIAALCNLNCSYCYVYNGADQSFRYRLKFIGDEVFNAALAAMRDYCDHRGQHRMSITFHGGEPMLIGAERFDGLATRALDVLGDRLQGMCIQTNGTLIDAPWAEVFHKHNIGVGISLDGPAHIHDRTRVDHQGDGSHAETMRGIERLRLGGVEPNILCVLTPGFSGADVYAYFRALGLKSIDFLLPDVSHDNKDLLYGAYGPTPVSDYLIPAFDAWFEEDDPGVKVRLFWGLIRMLMGGPGETDAFGNPLATYLIVETDGSIEALDALRVCEEGTARSGLNVLRNGFDDLRLGLPLLHQVVHEGLPLPAKCRPCPERHICGGGYLPHRYSRQNGFDNPSVWCADILKLLGHIRSQIGNAAVA